MKEKRYIIRRYYGRIEVLCDEKVYLTVKCTFNFWSKMFAVFTMDEKVILKSTHDVFVWKRYLAITYQNLDHHLILKKEKGRYILDVNNLSLFLKYNNFKSPMITIVDKDSILGTIDKVQKFGFISTHMDYSVQLYCSEENELFCLLRFLIELDDLSSLD
jgi:hypothetical protein